MMKKPVFLTADDESPPMNKEIKDFTYSAIRSWFLDTCGIINSPSSGIRQEG